MTSSPRGFSNVALALVHHPVYDRNRREVATAVTNLDIHDLARLARTYGMAGFYVVTPVDEQRELVQRITSHWGEGFGGSYNPDRREALSLLRVAATLDEVLAHMEKSSGCRPKIVVTGAKERENSLAFSALRRRIGQGEEQWLMLLGTGWGLTDEIFERADCVLEPVRGNGDYNHLSVRAAAAIIVDRLLGER